MAGLLDLVFPPACVACGVRGRVLCARCAAECPFLIPPICHRCGHPRVAGRDGWRGHRCPFAQWTFGGPPAFAQVRSVAAYDGVIKAAIRSFKYEGRRAIGPVLADLLIDRFPSDWVGVVSTVVPVPLHPARWRERGFNQADLLARPVARALGVPYSPRTLVRRRHHGAQAALDARARRLNVLGAFDAAPVPEGWTVLLVDDVFSTGATADACANALKRAGAETVLVQTLARTVLDEREREM